MRMREDPNEEMSEIYRSRRCSVHQAQQTLRTMLLCALVDGMMT